MAGSQKPNPAFVEEQVRAMERKLAALSVARAETLLELVERPADEDVHAAIEAFDTQITKLETRIDSLNAGLTEAGRRAAEEAAKRFAEHCANAADQAIEVAHGPMVDAARKIDEAWEALRAARDEFNANALQMRRLTFDGLRTTGRRNLNRGEFAMAYHGTLQQISDLLDSREGREIKMADYAERLAVRVETGIKHATKGDA